MTNTVIQMRIGLGLKNSFEHSLRTMKMQGHQIEWSHDGGWLTRNFTISGPAASLQIIVDAVQRFQAATQ